MSQSPLPHGTPETPPTPSRTSSRLPYFLAAVVAVGVVVAAAVGQDGARNVTVGAQAPAFQVHDLDGDPVALADYEGQVVLLNIWATWCLPCRQEMPSMQRLWEDYRDEDFAILAVSIDAAQGQTDEWGNPGGSIGAFVDELGLTFPILHNPSGSIQETYLTTGVPETFVIDRSGTIIQRVSGATEWDTPDRRALIDRLLAAES